jgi:2-methylisocitrate lyase-like PEP mutase family enzyme
MASIDFTARRTAFRALHDDGCFTLPNPWDAGSALRLKTLGFKALASTSAGAAWSLGHVDGGLSRDQVLDHLRMLCRATDLPVNADFEAGFADEPHGVAANVALAIDTGVAGLSIEDRVGRGLYDLDLAVERIRAARAAIDASGQDVVLVGRTEGFLIGQKDLSPTIDRLVAYAEAGADCLYAPGVVAIADVAMIVKAVSPRPVNVLMAWPGQSVAPLADIGVRRVSVGAALAGAAWSGFDIAAKMLAEQGKLPQI